MTALPKPSRSGVRVAGDMYQWLVVWLECVRMLRQVALNDPNPTTGVGVELDGVGNLDDVVTYRLGGPTTYRQVKYAVDASTPVSEEFLFGDESERERSIGFKLASAWKRIAGDAQDVSIVLLTNRAPDPNDPLISLRDSRTGLLLPKVADKGPRSILGKARKRWAETLGLTDDELLEMLALLRFETGKDASHLEEVAVAEMVAAGLRHDEHALHDGHWLGRNGRS